MQVECVHARRRGAGYADFQEHLDTVGELAAGDPGQPMLHERVVETKLCLSTQARILEGEHDDSLSRCRYRWGDQPHDFAIWFLQIR